MADRDITFRIRTARVTGTLGRVLIAIGEVGGHIGDIETLARTREYNVRDVTALLPDEERLEDVRRAIESVPGVQILSEIDNVFQVHEGGKLATEATVDVANVQDIREVYTPGVARVARAIAQDHSLADRYTWRANTVAVVSNGSRVLGLGDIGPAAALPVMEGKALFYSLLVGLNAVPIVLDAHDEDDFIETVVRLAPGFGGIHLEDIATPAAYRIEDELDRRLSIPVMHDDQHGTAVVVLAAALSAATTLGKGLSELRFGQVGLGAAGSAIARPALAFPFAQVHTFDPNPDASARMATIGSDVKRLHVHGGADGYEKLRSSSDVIVLTTGRPGLFTPDMVQPNHIILAISNPEPEIEVDAALRAGAALASDGTIVNNVLAYPGMFRGALSAGASRITTEMKVAAAHAIAERADGSALLPDPLDRSLHDAVAAAVATAAG